MFTQVKSLLHIILDDLFQFTKKRQQDYPEETKKQWVYGMILLLFPTMATKTSN